MEAAITTDYAFYLFLGLGALVVFWLVFSMVRKMFGLVLLAAVAAGAWLFWNNPELAQGVLNRLSAL